MHICFFHIHENHQTFVKLCNNFLCQKIHFKDCLETPNVFITHVQSLVWQPNSDIHEVFEWQNNCKFNAYIKDKKNTFNVYFICMPQKVFNVSYFLSH
jgi:hypothetical protein